MTTLTETMATYRNMMLNEAWDTKMHTAEKDKGMFKGKSKSEIRSGLSKDKKTAENDRKKGKPEPASLKKRIKQKEFALRAKNNFGKVDESFRSALKESSHPRMEAILQKFASDVDAFIESGFDLYSTSEAFQYALYEYYVSDMPYGTAKARTGDPDEFITEHFSKYLEDNGLLPDEDLNKAQIPPISEGKTQRKCKGKGCDKKCVDGKEFCSKKCSATKVVKENKFKPGPFSKKQSRSK